jgi:hypothetical protein
MQVFLLARQPDDGLAIIQAQLQRHVRRLCGLRLGRGFLLNPRTLHVEVEVKRSYQGRDLD